MSKALRSSRVRNQLVIKVSIIIVLLTCSLRVFAGCQQDAAAGWEVFSICEANFDSNGNYVNSTCNLGPPPEPSQSSINMCMAAPGVGGCSGSACTYGPLAD
jgi:hypothetical protein